MAKQIGMILDNEMEKVGRECYVIDWEIENFFSRTLNDCWRSPKFSFSGATWYLEISDKNYKVEQGNRSRPYTHRQTLNKQILNHEEIYVYLHKDKDESEIPLHNISCYLGIKGKSCEVSKTSFSRDGSFCGPFIFDLRVFNQGLVPPGFNQAPHLFFGEHVAFPHSYSFTRANIVISCIILVPYKRKTDAEAQPNAYSDFSCLSRDLKELFLSGEGTDVTIKVKGQKIKAHSQILAARSPVLAPMFRCDMKEKNTGEVEIEEFESEAFKEFIMFLYCGQSENMSRKNVIDLYCAAEKYNVEELKTKCRTFMEDDMSVDIFCDIMALAIEYSDTELINHSKTFFMKNVKDILTTVEWITFAKQYPIESNELFLGIVNKFVPQQK